MLETDNKISSSPPDLQSIQFNEADGRITFKDLISILWHYRIIITVLSLCAAAVIAAIFLREYFNQETHKFVSLELRIDFEGIDKNEYPNGMSFSTADIISTPVLNEVYNENDLKKYLGFSEFKAGLTIFQTNDQLRFLEYEYADKLRQTGLSLEERDRLENEFLAKKKTALVPIYILSYSNSEKTNAIPKILISKVLNDILRTWANHAQRIKGVSKYQYSLVSRNILSERNLEEVDYSYPFRGYEPSHNPLI